MYWYQTIFTKYTKPLKTKLNSEYLAETFNKLIFAYDILVRRPSKLASSLRVCEFSSGPDTVLKICFRKFSFAKF